MLDLTTAGRVAVRELDALIAGFEALSDDDWRRPTRCAGWTVVDLAVHCTLAPRAGAEAMRRMMAGVTDQPDWPAEPAAEPPAILDALRRGRTELAEAFAEVDESALASPCPLPFVTLPGTIALQLLVVELGTHHDDLRWSLGVRAPLPDDVIRAGTTFVPLLLPAIASTGVTPEGRVAYRLKGQTMSVSLAARDGSWTMGEDPSATTCEIVGDDSSLVLFALGRVGADHDGLTVSGDPSLATRFKSFFPGP